MDAAGLVSTRDAGLWMLPAHIGANHSTLTAVQQEFARVRALEHPHIARLLELGRNGNQYYVRSERLAGVSLRAVLTHLLPERVDVSEADEILLSIGAALVYAHAHGVAHGDVRADNVLVTLDRRFVLTNFLARHGGKIAPQPARPSDDLQGLARLAAELYVGARSGQRLRGAVLDDVPAARLTAVRAVLEAKPRQRPTSVAEFLAIADLPFAGARRSNAPQRRKRAAGLIVPLLATVLALVIVGVSYQLSGIGRRDAAPEPPATASALQQPAATTAGAANGIGVAPLGGASPDGE